ncbi:MAG: DciA family protein [Methylophilaceae bacterium]
MRQFSTLLHQPEFNALKAHSKDTAIAQALWVSIAPKLMLPFTRAKGIKNQQLLITADNNAVAAKIKLLAPSLLIQLENLGSEVTAILVKVQVKSTPEVKPKAIKNLSKKAADDIELLADKLAGTSLGDALSRLAAKAR